MTTKQDAEAVRKALRVAADAVATARAELDSATVGEDVLYGTRSKLCMALGLDLNASGIAIVDAARAVIRERDEARDVVNRCATALRRHAPEMAVRGGPCLPDEIDRAFLSLEYVRDEARAEVSRLMSYAKTRSAAPLDTPLDTSEGR